MTSVTFPPPGPIRPICLARLLCLRSGLPASGRLGTAHAGPKCVQQQPPPPARNHTCVNMNVRARPTQAPIPALSLVTCVTLDKLVDLSGSHPLALPTFKGSFRGFGKNRGVKVLYNESNTQMHGSAVAIIGIIFVIVIGSGAAEKAGRSHGRILLRLCSGAE